MSRFKEMLISALTDNGFSRYVPFLVIVISVFLADGFAMLFLSFSTPEPFYIYGLFHASIMTVLISPIFYLLLLRPLSLHIKERQKIEAELRKLSMVVEHTADLVVVTDMEGVIEYVNPSFSKLTGYPRDEVIGKNPSVIKSGIHNGRFYEQMWTILRSGDVFKAEFVNRKRNGDLYYEKKSITPVMDPKGNLTHFVSTGKDVTEQRLAEIEKEKIQAQYYHAQKMEAIGTLAGGIAHDFNNLMTAVQGFSSLAMERTDPGTPILTYLERINSASCRAADLASQLLLFSRKQPMELNQISINTTIKNIMCIIERLIGENIVISVNLESCPCTVTADEGKVVQVIMNLAVNAKDAMPDGGNLMIETKKISIDGSGARRIPEAVPGDYICISVSDTGLGINKDVLDRIFEPFFTTKEVGKGTGLGLSVVYGIVKEHGGWINVSSGVGAGTTFKVYLPTSIPKVDESPTTASSIPSVYGEGKRVLLVEDEKHLLEFASLALRESGYDVLEAASAEEALELFQKENGRFDLVVSDVVLPGRNGVELGRQITGINPELKIVFCSGYADPNLIVESGGLVEGKYEFLKKPYRLTDLLQKLNKLEGSH